MLDGDPALPRGSFNALCIFFCPSYAHHFKPDTLAAMFCNHSLYVNIMNQLHLHIPLFFIVCSTLMLIENVGFILTLAITMGQTIEKLYLSTEHLKVLSI